MKHIIKWSCYDWTEKNISNEAVMSELWNTVQMKLIWVSCETYFKWDRYEWNVKHFSNEAFMSELWNTFQMKLLWLNCETRFKWSYYEWTVKHISNEAVMSEVWSAFWLFTQILVESFRYYREQTLQVWDHSLSKIIRKSKKYLSLVLNTQVSNVAQIKDVKQATPRLLKISNAMKVAETFNEFISNIAPNVISSLK